MLQLPVIVRIVGRAQAGLSFVIGLALLFCFGE